ncbi:serine/threonine protein kinase, partial [Streptomyces sp. NPDC057235]
RDLYATLITDQTRILGPDHEHTLTGRHQHAYYIGEAGDPATARDLYATLITDRTRILGPDHEHTLLSRHQHEHWAFEVARQQ